MSAYDSDADPLGNTPNASSSESDWSNETSEEDISGYSREDMIDDQNTARMIPNTPESPGLPSAKR
jgi:hypothetical protein